VRTVVTHCFEGPVALAAASALALALPNDHPSPLACGLDRHAALDAWPELPLPMLTDASVQLLDTPGLGIAPLPVTAATRIFGADATLEQRA
jgi:L-alanine-DL-glutamate epimerase-like enolase superfamily enzyme